MAPFNLDSYKDFVLKLKIKAADGSSQIRRVRLPRIADQNGHVSYEELVGLVITFHFPSSAPGSPENFICSLTYFDEDEDTVTIASTDELVDAVEQFADKKVLRITTEVKPRGATTSLPHREGTSFGSTCKTKEASTQPQIQNVLDSFVGVLVSAVNSLEKELVTPAKDPKVAQTARPCGESARDNKPKHPAYADASSPCAEFSKKKEDPAMNIHASPPCVEYNKDTAHILVSPPCSEFSKKKQEASKAESEQFVHHRHTCDACLKTPIVGSRYHALNVSDFDICEGCFKNYSGIETHFEEHPSGKTVEKVHRVPEPPSPKPVVTAAPTQPEPETLPKKEPARRKEAEKELPFIHGRHTCDQCLKTPIIGKRFHATNMGDYDFCERCYNAYDGTELHFEPAELARDRAFQKRWQRRRQRIEKMKVKANKQNHGPARFPVPATEESSVPDSAVTTPASTGSLPIQTAAENDDFDGALKEAIRRSLEDVKEKESQEHKAAAQNSEGDESKAPVVDHAATQKEDIYADAVEEAEDGLELPTATEETMPVDPEMKQASENLETGDASHDRKPAAVDDQDEEVFLKYKRIIGHEGPFGKKSPSWKGDRYNVQVQWENGEVTYEPLMNYDFVACALYASENGLLNTPGWKRFKKTSKFSKRMMKKGKQAKKKSADPVEETVETPTEAPVVLAEMTQTSFEEVVDEQELFDAMEETMSVDSEKMASAEDGDICETGNASPDRKPAAVDLENSGGTSPTSKKDDSFALDAVGNGDVAEAMGATLDTIAGVISEMLSEAETHSNPRPPSIISGPEILPSEETPEPITLDEPKEENAEEAPGSLILDSEDQAGQTWEAEDEWQVVEEAERTGDEIAHATQMLGSALFNSDIQSSQNHEEHENVSQLTSSDCFSSPTSVPSTVQSIQLGSDASCIAPAQRNRWASQLEKLQELGFDDETLCVETLERLQAANIGCNETDEISVTQVVNAILERK